MRKLLLVDDDTNIFGAVRMALGDNYNVSHVVSVAEAQALLKKDHSFDLILLDLMMPGASGTDFLDYSRQMKLKMPVIVISSLDSSSCAADAMHRGASYYLAKPFSSAELKAVMAKVLSR